MFVARLRKTGPTGCPCASFSRPLHGPSADSNIVTMMQDVPAGAVVLEVPLSLALTDHLDDAESNSLLEAGSPWAVRLACKLLRERAQGPQSAWWPYLQVGKTGVAQHMCEGGSAVPWAKMPVQANAQASPDCKGHLMLRVAKPFSMQALC